MLGTFITKKNGVVALFVKYDGIKWTMDKLNSVFSNIGQWLYSQPIEGIK